MNWLLLFLISTPVFAQDPSVSAYCRAQTNFEVKSALGRELQDLNVRFDLQEKREANPKALVEGFDSIISKTEFADVLSCRKWFNYRVRVIPVTDADQTMKLVPTYAKNGETLEMELRLSLTSPIDSLLFAYFHESVHVCQQRELEEKVIAYYAGWEALTTAEKYYYSKREDAKEKGTPNLEFEKLQSEVGLTRILGEVEAYRLMYLAFAKLAQDRPALCHYRTFEFYQTFENDLRDGYFAQSIFSLYGETADPLIFDFNSEKKTYVDWALGKTYELHRFQRDVIEKIKQLGVNYAEPI